MTVNKVTITRADEKLKEMGWEIGERVQDTAISEWGTITGAIIFTQNFSTFDLNAGSYEMVELTMDSGIEKRQFNWKLKPEPPAELLPKLNITSREDLLKAIFG